MLISAIKQEQTPEMKILLDSYCRGFPNSDDECKGKKYGTGSVSTTWKPINFCYGQCDSISNFLDPCDPTQCCSYYDAFTPVSEVENFERILYPSSESSLTFGNASDWFTFSASSACLGQEPSLYTYHLRDYDTNEEISEGAKIDPLTGVIELVMSRN